MICSCHSSVRSITHSSDHTHTCQHAHTPAIVEKDNPLIRHCHTCHNIFLVHLWKIIIRKILTDRKVLMISSCHSSIRSIAHSSNNTHLTTQDIFPISKMPYTSYDTTHSQDIFPIRNTHACGHCQKR